MKQPQYEKKVAIENCIRSFIIKSIHAIVQARNGVVYNTNCVSAVGARNNLMVNIEEDPEIGATIKQTLDAAFPVHVRDILSLEISTAWPNNERMVVEVWQFQLDTTDRLNVTLSDTDHPPQVPSPGTEHGRLEDATKLPNEVAVEDFRQLRLFEKLGTLLKSIIVATRILPAYRLSRNQDPTKYQMCYTLRRGSTNLTRLGSEAKSQQIGRLFSGLAVKPCPTTGAAEAPTGTTVQADDSANMDQVFLNCTVHYRQHFPPAPSSVPKTSGQYNKIEGPSRLRSSPRYTKTGRLVSGGDPRMIDRPPELGHSPRVRPAFAEGGTEDALDEGYPSHLFFDPDCENDYMDPMWASDIADDDEDELISARRRALEEDFGDAGDDTDMSETIYPKEAAKAEEQDADDDGCDAATPEDHRNVPLQLPFSTVGVSGDQWNHLFLELRQDINLDLFKVPSGGGNASSGGNPQAQSSLFDADALNEELERHEKILKEFDEFFAKFCSIENPQPHTTLNANRLSRDLT